MTTNLTATGIVLLIVAGNLLTVFVLLLAAAVTFTIHKLVERLVDAHEEWKRRRFQRRDLETCRAIDALGASGHQQGDVR
ncbi:hypothetical protein ACFRFJ_15705 [Streptomyces hydrogenans]|uniref:hypothetical protein n=1 Tax=Streptomyces hydrogenans TaxID=1873719 RepID=UPI0036C507F0